MAEDLIQQVRSVENVSMFFAEKEYYVYDVIVDGVVRYVGKGRARRAKRHVGIAAAVTKNDKHRYARSAFYKKLGCAIEAGSLVEIRYIANGLSSEQAFDLEIRRISEIGLENLWNSTHGGEGIRSELAKSFAKARWKDFSQREKHRERLKAVYADPDVRLRHQASLQRNLTSQEREVRSKNAHSRWARPGERERQSANGKAIAAARAAKKIANLYCGSLSFGC